MSPATTAWWIWWLSMLDMHRQLSSAGPEHERTLLAAASRLRTGRSTGRSAELYGLTEEEIGLVEAGAK